MRSPSFPRWISAGHPCPALPTCNGGVQSQKVVKKTTFYVPSFLGRCLLNLLYSINARKDLPGLTIQASITSMAIPETKVSEQNFTGKSSNVSYGAQLCLRILSIATTLAAALVMVTCRQSITVFGIRVDARYSYSSAFR